MERYSSTCTKGILVILMALVVLPVFGVFQKQTSDVQTTEYSGYTLVWSDEFTTDGPIDDEKWYHQTKLPNGDAWFNGEVQHYTDRIENAVVSNGVLKITAKKESFTDQGKTKAYTSARLNSKFAFTYGRVDVLAKLPAVAGTWPAIWTLGQNINENGGYWDNEGFGTTNWPFCGEIDIMEQFADKLTVTSALHNGQSSGNTENKGALPLANSTTAFNLYSIVWDSDQIQFLVNGEAYYTYNPETKYPSIGKNNNTWPFDKPQYLLLNIAMGGFAGEIDPAFTESSMEIDYVRVYSSEDQPSGPSVPQVAAPRPNESESDVRSIFSDSFEDVVGTDFAPFWNQSIPVTVEMEEIEGNSSIKYAPLSYQGIVLGSSQDISKYDRLHIDVWSPDIEILDFYLISPGPVESKISIELEAEKWNFLELDLSIYQVAGVNLEDIIQFKFVDNSGGGTIWIDNIYFVDRSQTPLSGNADLSELLIDNIPISTFSADQLTYEVVIDNTDVLPNISATAVDEHAEVTIAQSGMLESWEITVLAENREISKVYSIEFIEEPLKTIDVVSFRSYPNPAGAELTLKFEEFSHLPKSISLTDLAGHVFNIHSTLDSEAEELVIDVSDLSPGLYFVQFVQDGRRYKSKFIKK